MRRTRRRRSRSRRRRTRTKITRSKEGEKDKKEHRTKKIEKKSVINAHDNSKNEDTTKRN